MQTETWLKMKQESAVCRSCWFLAITYKSLVIINRAASRWWSRESRASERGRSQRDSSRWWRRRETRCPAGVPGPETGRPCTTHTLQHRNISRVHCSFHQSATHSSVSRVLELSWAGAREGHHSVVGLSAQLTTVTTAPDDGIYETQLYNQHTS